MRYPHSNGNHEAEECRADVERPAYSPSPAAAGASLAWMALSSTWTSPLPMYCRRMVENLGWHSITDSILQEVRLVPDSRGAGARLGPFVSGGLGPLGHATGPHADGNED